MRFPDGFASNLRKNVSDVDGKISGLKSHDCHIIIQRLLGHGLRKFLPKEISDTIGELCNFFRIITSRTLRVNDLKAASKDVVLILCKLEMIFPPAFFDIMVHLILHLPDEAIHGGPVHSRWMYPIERCIGSLKQYVRNRARPEGSIAEGYVVNEALTFCSLYFRSTETRLNRPDRYGPTESNVNAKTLSVFQHSTRLLGSVAPVLLEEPLRSGQNGTS